MIVNYKIENENFKVTFCPDNQKLSVRNKKKLYSWTLSRIPQKRWGEPNEISELIYFLISDNSNYITGENINIDGGWLSA